MFIGQLVKDIFEHVHLEYYEKLVDQYLGGKVLGMVVGWGDGKQGLGDDKDGDKLVQFAIQTIVFWTKRLSFMQKSAFSQAYEQLKKMKIQIPKQFQYYKREMMVELWKKSSNTPEQPTHPLLQTLQTKFQQSKQTLQTLINSSILNDQQVPVTPILQSLRQFLLYFFSNYRIMQQIETQERDIIIVQFHILNNLYKKICNLIYISIQDIISLTKQIFQVVYPSEYDSVDRLDVVELAGVFKYNALTVFQRIHQRIQKEEALLGPFKLSINLEQNEKPPLPSSNTQPNISNSRAGSMQRFARTMGN